jgi:ribosomal protein S6--L-glutamate ligase
MLDSLSYPVVVKSAVGGEGENIFFVPDRKTMNDVLERIRLLERSGVFGFLIQDYVPNNGKDLRVIIMGKRLYAYWRVASEGEFLHNISKGATLDLKSDEKKIQAGILLGDTLRKLTGINLAGIDVIFHKEDLEGKNPLLLEVNYFFGRKGLGGDAVYYQLLNETVREWLSSLPGD